MPERLTVVKRAGCYLVAYDDAGEDWVARFELDGDFPAEDWAKRLAFLFNTRADARDQESKGEADRFEPGVQ